MLSNPKILRKRIHPVMGRLRRILRTWWVK